MYVQVADHIDTLRGVVDPAKPVAARSWQCSTPREHLWRSGVPLETECPEELNSLLLGVHPQHTLTLVCGWSVYSVGTLVGDETGDLLPAPCSQLRTRGCRRVGSCLTLPASHVSKLRLPERRTTRERTPTLPRNDVSKLSPCICEPSYGTPLVYRTAHVGNNVGNNVGTTVVSE